MTRETAFQLLEFVALTLPAVLLYLGVLYVILGTTSRDERSAPTGRRTSTEPSRATFWRTTAIQQKDFALALASLLLLLSSALVLVSALWVPNDASLLVAQTLILLSFFTLLLSFGATFYLSLVRSHELRTPKR